MAAPQEAMMDAMLIKHLSRLCRKQAEEMSANIAQFRHKEYLERLVASMRGRGGPIFDPFNPPVLYMYH